MTSDTGALATALPVACCGLAPRHVHEHLAVLPDEQPGQWVQRGGRSLLSLLLLHLLAAGALLRSGAAAIGHRRRGLAGARTASAPVAWSFSAAAATESRVGPSTLECLEDVDRPCRRLRRSASSSSSS